MQIFHYLDEIYISLARTFIQKLDIYRLLLSIYQHHAKYRTSCSIYGSTRRILCTYLPPSPPLCTRCFLIQCDIMSSLCITRCKGCFDLSFVLSYFSLWNTPFENVRIIKKKGFASVIYPLWSYQTVHFNTQLRFFMLILDLVSYGFCWMCLCFDLEL